MDTENEPELIRQFVMRWNSIISKIESNPMPQAEINKIREEFLKDAKTMLSSHSLVRWTIRSGSDKWQDALEASSDKIDDARIRLTTACAISHSKWKETHPGLLERIKIAVNEFNIFKKG